MQHTAEADDILKCIFAGALRVKSLYTYEFSIYTKRVGNFQLYILRGHRSEFLIFLPAAAILYNFRFFSVFFKPPFFSNPYFLH